MFFHSNLLQLCLKKNKNITELFPDTTSFLIKKSCCELMRYKYIVLLTNHILLYTRLTYVKPYKNILERFSQKCSYDDWYNGPIRLQYIPIYGHNFHPYNTFYIHLY